ncbi:MAG: hypothetical protein ACYDH9_22380 [Limisphaerales bacterium]
MARFLEAASQDLVSGPKRKFQLFDPLDFLAEVTQHIPAGQAPAQSGSSANSSQRRSRNGQASPSTSVFGAVSLKKKLEMPVNIG